MGYALESDLQVGKKGGGPDAYSEIRTECIESEQHISGASTVVNALGWSAWINEIWVCGRDPPCAMSARKESFSHKCIRRHIWYDLIPT